MSKKEKDEYSIALGMKIVEARKKNNISQKELADRLDISPTRLNYWEKGKAKPDIKMIEEISSILNISISKLLGWDSFEKQIKEENAFISYLKSLGYSYSTDFVEVLESHIEDVTDDSGTIIGQTQVIDKEIVNHLLSKEGITSVFTEEEFIALQDKNKESLEGAILLQSRKNKKEKPPSAATDNGSSNENTVK